MVTLQGHSFRVMCIMFIWKMAHNFQFNFQSNCQIFSQVIFVQVVLISWNFVGNMYTWIKYLPDYVGNFGPKSQKLNSANSYD